MAFTSDCPMCRHTARPGVSKAPKRAGKRKKAESELPEAPPQGTLQVRRMHRRDTNRVWEFLKLVFRGVNKETVEYQRPFSKQRFMESYDDRNPW